MVLKVSGPQRLAAQLSPMVLFLAMWFLVVWFVLTGSKKTGRRRAGKYSAKDGETLQGSFKYNVTRWNL